MRITKSDLETGVARLNHLAGTPKEPYSKGEDGHYHPNALCYHLSGAYGGYQVQQICTQGTGVHTPITAGHVTKRECYDTLHAFINGMEAAHAA